MTYVLSYVNMTTDDGGIYVQLPRAVGPRRSSFDSLAEVVCAGGLHADGSWKSYALLSSHRSRIQTLQNTSRGHLRSGLHVAKVDATHRGSSARVSVKGR
jgi:hypothetical protein